MRQKGLLSLSEFVIIVLHKNMRTLSHFNYFHVFPRDNIRKTFTVIQNTILEYSDTLSFALQACIILYINGKQFMCSIFILFSIYATSLQTSLYSFNKIFKPLVVYRF